MLLYMFKMLFLSFLYEKLLSLLLPPSPCRPVRCRVPSATSGTPSCPSPVQSRMKETK